MATRKARPVKKLLKFSWILLAVSCAAAAANAQRAQSCTDVANFRIEGVEITRTEPVAAGAISATTAAGVCTCR